MVLNNRVIRERHTAMASGDSASLFGLLSDDLLLNVFRSLSSDAGTYDHALVCRRWGRLSAEAQEMVRAREGGLMEEMALAQEIAQFKNLKAVQLPKASLWGLTDRFLREVAKNHPELESLEVLSDSTREVNLMSSQGLSNFLEACPNLRILRLQTESHWEDFAHGFLLPKLSAAASKNLEVLECPVRSLPEDMSPFAGLSSLSLSSENISVLPASISALGSIRSLELVFPRLAALPAEVGALASLQSLSLRCERVTVLPPSLLALPALRSLHLACAVDSILAPELAGASAQQLPPVPAQPGPTAMEGPKSGMCNARQGAEYATSAAGAGSSVLPQVAPLQSLVISGCKKLRYIAPCILLGLRHLTHLETGDALACFASECTNANVSGKAMASLRVLEHLVVKEFTGEELPSFVAELGSLKVLELVDCRAIRTALRKGAGMYPALGEVRVIGCMALEQGPLPHCGVEVHGAIDGRVLGKLAAIV